MSADRKLESLTLDKLVGRYHELEDENARLVALVGKMQPIVECACILNSHPMRENNLIWSQLAKNIQALAEHRSAEPA